MSFSSDGIIYFGVDYGEDLEEAGLPWATPEILEEDEDGEGADFEDWYCKVVGAPNTDDLWAEFYAWRDTPEGVAKQEEMRAAKDYRDLYRYYEEIHPEWRDALVGVYEARREAKESIPVVEVHHCSYDYPMYGLAVTGSVLRAYRGSPVQLDLPAMNMALVGARQLAEAFCEEHGIPFTDPQWILASIMG